MSVTENLIKKKKELVDNLKGQKDNLEKSDENIQEIRKGLDTTSQIVKKEIEETDKSIKLWENIPDKALIVPSEEVKSMVTSGYTTSISGLLYSKNLYSKTIICLDNVIVVEGTAVSSIPTVSSSCSLSYGANQLVGEDFPEIKPTFESIEIETIYDKKDEVAELLKTVDERLNIQFEGMWQTKDDASKKDRVKQSAHSMKEVISILLQRLAPDDQVMSCKWYKSEKKDELPTQKQRAKYAILGKTEEGKLTYDDLAPIYDTIKDLRKRFKELNGIAHARGEEDPESLMPLLESIIKSGQNLIITLFKLRKSFLPHNINLSVYDTSGYFLSKRTKFFH